MENKTVTPIDPVELTQALIRCASVTPSDHGAMDIVESNLKALGFQCYRLRFEGIENLYARRGTQSPNLCFAGHTDVVPAGTHTLWKYDPFGANIIDDHIIGRGCVDMKGAIAAYLAAVSRLSPSPAHSLSFLITGDEEGQAINGTRRVVEHLKQINETIDHCIVGEPSSVSQLGDMIKIGRRGSINVTIEVIGTQGHVAYPDRANNPIPVLNALLYELSNHVLDDGYDEFQPSNLEITNLDVGNPTTNLIPRSAKGRFNIRFNPNHTGQALKAWIEDICNAYANKSGCEITIDAAISGEAFLTQSHEFIDLITENTESVLGIRPKASTSGGTSDARFIRDLCPVIELGLVGQTMHMINETVNIDDLRNLTDLYETIITAYGTRLSSPV